MEYSNIYIRKYEVIENIEEKKIIEWQNKFYSYKYMEWLVATIYKKYDNDIVKIIDVCDMHFVIDEFVNSLNEYVGYELYLYKINVLNIYPNNMPTIKDIKYKINNL